MPFDRDVDPDLTDDDSTNRDEGLRGDPGTESPSTARVEAVGETAAAGDAGGGDTTVFKQHNYFSQKEKVKPVKKPEFFLEKIHIF